MASEDELAEIKEELRGDLNWYKLKATAMGSQRVLEAIKRMRRLLGLDDLEEVK